MGKTGQTSKQRVLAHLEARKGAFVSGGELADELGLSRNAIWKAVNALKEHGYPVESVTGKGYRLPETCSMLSAASIERHLAGCPCTVHYFETIDSTNVHCKELAHAGHPHGTLVAADCQTHGRGRRGRSFHSPAGCGVYFSVLLRPQFILEDATLVTSFAAVALARTIERVCGKQAQIKWVNDVFVDGRKVSGILTEASFDAESFTLDYLVVGIGVNIFDPPDTSRGDEHFHSILGNVSDTCDIRARIVAETTRALIEGCGEIPLRGHLQEYRERSILDGRTVRIEDRTLGTTSATVLGVNDDFTLRVELPDGRIVSLLHGDVHIPSEQL